MEYANLLIFGVFTLIIVAQTFIIKALKKGTEDAISLANSAIAELKGQQLEHDVLLEKSIEILLTEFIKIEDYENAQRCKIILEGIQKRKIQKD